MASQISHPHVKSPGKTPVKNGCQTLSSSPPGGSCHGSREGCWWTRSPWSVVKPVIPKPRMELSLSYPLFIGRSVSQANCEERISAACERDAWSEGVVAPRMQAGSTLQRTESCSAYGTPVQVLGRAESSRFWRLLQHILNYLFFCI